MEIIKYNSSSDRKEGRSNSSGYNNSFGAGGGNNSTASDTSNVTGVDELWKKGNGQGALVPKNGYNVAEGQDSIAIGSSTQTTNQGELAMGVFNKSTLDDTLFSIGDGHDEDSRHNVFEVNNIGNVHNTGTLTSDENIEAKGELKAPVGNITTVNSDYVNTKNLNADNIKADKLDASYIHGDEVNSDKFTVGDKEKGQWIIEEDENVDLHVHIPQDETFRVSPNDVDVFDVSQDKVHISTKLDLTNSDDGTNVSMGKSVNYKKNTNIKSIVEEGFYFTDSENNVAIGIGNNYIQMGIDMGSPNFISGSYGWRVQPDGTAEFQNLKVDGNLDVYVITYNEMRATNGILLVTDVGCITDVIDNTIEDKNYWIFTISEFPPFAVDDYVLLQYKVDETRILSFKGIVTAVNEDGKNTVRVLCLSGFEGQGTSDDDRGTTTFKTIDPETASGQYLIRIGNKTDKNRQTIIKLNPYDGGYIDFMKGLNSENILASEDNIKDKLPTACRIGNLSGITYKGTTLEGYGLYADNAYLTGAIKNLENTWSLNEDGSGNVAGNHITWDKDGNLKIMLGDKELNSYINGIYNELDGKITATAEDLTSDYTKKITDTSTDLEGKINTTKTDLEGKITQSAESLTSAYTKKITDTESNINGKVDKKVTELEGKIKQSAESLQSDYNKKITDVDGKISTVESNFTQTANSISGRVKSIEDDYITSSELTVATDSISSRVTAIENDYAKSSEITQNADNIKVAVYDELKNKTGIDVQTGRIIIDADKTEFTGNIILSDPNEGIIINDNYGNPKINIQNNTLGTLDNFDFGVNKGIKLQEETTYNTGQTTVTYTFATQTLGTLKVGQKLVLSNMGFGGYYNTKPFNTNVTSASYSYVVKCGSTTVSSKSGTATKNTDKWPCEWRIPDNTLSSVSYAGTYTYTLTVTLNLAADSRSYTGKFFWDAYINSYAPTTNIIRLATDGAVIAASDTQYNWFGSDKTQLRNGASAIRAYNGKLQRNSVNTNSSSFSDKWSDLSSTVPYRIVNSATYTATTDDCFIFFSTVLGNNEAQRVLYLPHPSTCPGKFYFVKNGEINNTIAFVSGHTTEYMFVWHSATNKQYSIKFDAESEIFISCGIYWVSFNCD